MSRLYQLMTERPESFDLNIESPLYRGLVFAGLGSVSKGYRYTDSSIQGNHGTLTGFSGAGDTPAAQWRWDGYLRRWVLGFDGSNDYVLHGFSSAMENPNFTVSFWLDMTGAPGGFGGVIGNLHDSGGGVYGGWQVLFRQNSLVGYLLKASSSGSVELVSPYWLLPSLGSLWPVSVRVTHWQTVRFTAGANSGTRSQSTTTFKSVGSPLKLGYDEYTDCHLQGSLGDVLVHNRVLADGEIAALADPSNVDLRVGGVPLILPPRRRLFAAAAAGFKPYWIRRQQQISGVL